MSVTIQILISFLRDQISDFDKRSTSFRKCVPEKLKNKLTEEIWSACKNYAKEANNLIEFEAGRHTKAEHTQNEKKCFRRITSK